MSKKQKKVKRARMNPETKEKLQTGFLTLINNDAAIKAAREYHWWMPIILAVCGVILTLVPSFVTNMQVNMGEAVLSANGTSVANGLAKFQADLKEKNIDFGVNADGLLSYDEATAKTLYNAGGTETTANYYYEAKSDVTGEPQLRVVFTEDMVSQTYLNALSQREVSTTAEVAGSDGTTSETITKTTYRVSVLAFKPSGFSFAAYPDRSTSTSNAFVSYTYDGLKGQKLSSLTPEGSLTSDPQTFVSSTRSNYRNLLTKGYESEKISLAWKNVGILAGINGGIVILLGFVLFLVTRGKNNPYRVITLWECQKIAYWEVMAPAILALGLGFLFNASMSSIGMFLFLFLYGMRIMWTSMKAFSPQGK